MKAKWLLAAALVCSPAYAWELPPDNGIMGKAAIAEILSHNDYPETTTFTQKIEYIDFAANGQNFTQVVVTLTPAKPRLHNGKTLTVVGGEPGSEYGMDFIKTVENKESMGPWLAKRGVAFVALTRVGRWNFMAPAKDGSWETIPLDKRMPIFNRAQKTYWTDADFETVKNDAATGTPGANVSAVARFPRKNSLLEKQMLAATPAVMMQGYKLALDRAIPDRKNSFVLFWGMSTGGATLYPLAKLYTPDGYLGWGTSSTGLAYVMNKARNDDYSDVYAKSALRVRERGFDDFTFYTKNIDAKTREQWWKVALKDPRFKSVEDASMMFGAAGLTEHALRLWKSDFLPAEERKKGPAAFVMAMFEPSLPPAELKTVPVLDLNGTEDEPLPPPTVDSNRKAMQPYAKKWRVGRIEGFHHYLFTQDSIKVVGSTWFRFIDGGYFD